MLYACTYLVKSSSDIDRELWSAFSTNTTALSCGSEGRVGVSVMVAVR